MPIPAADPDVDGVTATITGPVKLPSGVAPLEGTWYARIRTLNGATIDSDGTIRGGIQSVYDDGSGATMTLPVGSYEFRFQSSALNQGTNQPDQFGWYPFDLLEDTLWGVIMETPVEVPVTPSDVALAQEAAAQAVAANDAAQLVGTTNDTVIAGRINEPTSATRSAADALYPSKATLPVSLLTYAAADGTNQTANVQAAIDATPTGGTLDIPATALGTGFRVDGQLNVTRAMTISSRGLGGFYSSASTTAQKMLNITASDVTLGGIKVKGPQMASAVQYGIYATGTSGTSPISRLRITGCEVSNWGLQGIYAAYVRDFTIDRNEVRDIAYAGIGVLSAVGGSISRNQVKNITQPSGYVNSYGIYTSRAQTANLTADPRSANIVIDGNVISDIPGWAGVDTHGGQNLNIRGNSITNCSKPISMVSSSNGTAFVYAPLEVNVSGNTITSGVTNGTADSMHIIGNATERGTGSVTNNIIRGHGLQGAGTSGAIQFDYTRGVVCTGNVVIEPSPAGITWVSENSGFVCTGNTIIDIWSNSILAKGVLVNGVNNVGHIDRNTLLSATKTAPQLAAGGFLVFVSNSAGNAIQLGSNIAGTATSALYDPALKTATTFGEKPTITGSRGGNAALASILTQLATKGLITDSTTA